MFKKGDKLRLIPGKLHPAVINFKKILTYDKPYRNSHFFSKEYPQWALENESYELIYIKQFKNKLDNLLND